MHLKVSIVIIGIIAICSSPAWAQDIGRRDRFDSVAISEYSSVSHESSASAGIVISPVGAVTAVYASLSELIGVGFSVDPAHVRGLPDWAIRSRFDVSAKAPNGLPAPDVLRAMFRTLLLDRFKMAGHVETTGESGHVLTVARSGIGPELRTSRLVCAETLGTTRDLSARRLFPQTRLRCGFERGNGSLVARGVTIAQLSSFLGETLGVTVQDRTKLVGHFDLRVTWKPDAIRNQRQAPATAISSAERARFLNAIGQQLGLSITATAQQQRVFVVDRVLPLRSS
jgi:uncharacterized protein (TIGR03435 family)